MTRRPWTPEDRAEVCRRYPHERNGHLAPSWCKQARTAIADAEKTK